MSNLEKDLQDFLTYLEVEKQRSLLTIRNYGYYLQRFINFAKERAVTRSEEITLPLVNKYRQMLNRLLDRENRPLKKVTQNYHIIALRAFLKYLAKKDRKVLSAEKIELGKGEPREIAYLEPEEVERLLVSYSDEDIISVRNRAVLEVLFSTGLRVSELVSLNRDKINLERGEFPVIGKGKKERIVFLSESARAWLAKYLQRRRDKDPALFIRHTKTGPKPKESLRLSVRAIERIVEEAGRRAGLGKRVFPHELRHSMATDLLINGADLRSVQALLGHSSVTTTQVYTHITNKHLREVHKEFHRKRAQNTQTSLVNDDQSKISNN